MGNDVDPKMFRDYDLFVHMNIDCDEVKFELDYYLEEGVLLGKATLIFFVGGRLKFVTYN